MKKVLKITAIVAAALFLTVYGVGCWYFYTHYFYGTKIDGVVYGCMTPEEVVKYVDENTICVVPTLGCDRTTAELQSDDPGKI